MEMKEFWGVWSSYIRSSECKDMENLQGVVEKDGGEDFGFKNYEKKKKTNNNFDMPSMGSGVEG
jgi:hypothetical protein